MAETRALAWLRDPREGGGNRAGKAARLRKTFVLFLFSYYPVAVHPPQFSPHHRLGDWPDCVLDVSCPCHVGGFSHLPVRMLRNTYGNLTFKTVMEKLRCSRCGGPPAPVYLVAGHHRTFHYGPEPDWAVELNRVQFETDSRALGCVPHSSSMAIFR
jgi:hypothetical protein